jgi:hypothetical protein
LIPDEYVSADPIPEATRSTVKRWWFPETEEDSLMTTTTTTSDAADHAGDVGVGVADDAGASATAADHGRHFGRQGLNDANGKGGGQGSYLLDPVYHLLAGHAPEFSFPCEEKEEENEATTAAMTSSSILERAMRQVVWQKERGDAVVRGGVGSASSSSSSDDARRLEFLKESSDQHKDSSSESSDLNNDLIDDLNEEEVSGMKVTELKSELRVRGLPLSGRKADLVHRLLESMAVAQKDLGRELEQEEQKEELYGNNDHSRSSDDNSSSSGDGSLVLEAVAAAAAALKPWSFLAVQGPPGTGKTTAGALVVADAVERGQRVVVTANSHKVLPCVMGGRCLLLLLLLLVGIPSSGVRRELRGGNS